MIRRSTPRLASPRRSATPRSRPRCRTRCTCPRTSSPGSGCGSNRSTRTVPGTARPGDVVTAQAEIGKLQSLEEKLVAAKDTYWANQVKVQRLGAEGVLAQAQGDAKKAVELVRAAADLDAMMDKHPATPAAVLPARELLADLLLELKEPSAALSEYEQSLK